jgi:tetrathionate reductase subunit B
MGKVLIIDITKCNGCHNCQIACKDEHVGNDWSPVAKPQPMAGQFWTKVEDKVRGTVPKVKVSYLHSVCRHCDDAPCIKACPNQAIYKRPDGIVIIDPEQCKGSRKCMQECPYDDVIYFNEELNIAQKCTFCAHLVDKGWDETRCSDACPTGAFTFGEEEQLRDLIATSDRLMMPSGAPESSLKPRVFFIGIPKRFLGATIFDPEADEVIIGADVNLTAISSNYKSSVKTDDFGDFWIDGLEPGKYKIEITKSGFQKIEMEANLSDSDINLGDIPMQGEGR